MSRDLRLTIWRMYIVMSAAAVTRMPTLRQASTTPMETPPIKTNLGRKWRGTTTCPTHNDINRGSRSQGVGYRRKSDEAQTKAASGERTRDMSKLMAV